MQLTVLKNVSFESALQLEPKEKAGIRFSDIRKQVRAETGLKGDALSAKVEARMAELQPTFRGIESEATSKAWNYSDVVFSRTASGERVIAFKMTEPKLDKDALISKQAAELAELRAEMKALVNAAKPSAQIEGEIIDAE